jgi:ATP-binding cassette subfamily F protein 3
MLTAHQISKSYQLNKILVDVSFNINAGERVGLIGPNGCGKTTLLRILTGEETADSGHVSLTPTNLRVGYLTQGFEPAPGISVKSLIQEASGDPKTLEDELIHLSTALATDPDQPEIQAKYDAILWQLEQPSSIGRLSSILAGLGLDQLPEDQIAATLSGGQKTRLALALMLLTEPQLLLLDEPTNHLDIEMLEWLEDWLNEFRGAALIVSHDRAFLERTVTRILDLNPSTHTIKSYEGSYNNYIEAITTEQEKQWQAYNDQMAEIRRMKRDIARTQAQAERTEREASSIRIGGGMMKLKGYKDYQQGIAKKVAKKAKSRQKKLDRYLDSDERVEKPKAGWQIKLEFDGPAHLGKQVLTLEDLTVGYPDYPPLLQMINLHVQAGQRIAFTGPNGSGKTTLLRTIAGKLTPVAGQTRLGSTVKLGYMSQEQETLDPKKNAVEIIQSAAPFNQTETRNFLHYYLFQGDDPLRPIEQLSYGERARLMLARLVAQGCNFLLLDEPINHLDIPSREQFEQALAGFDGTVLAVVHDRYFIERFASELWVVQNSNVRREVLKIPAALAEM